MANAARRTGLALLLCVMWVLTVSAQDAAVGKVVGSSAVGAVFRAAVGDGLTYELAGAQAGLSQFCLGQADLAVAGRVLTQSEGAICQNNGVQFQEVLFGVDGYALIASPDVTFVSCLSTDDLNALVSPSAASTVSSWRDFAASNPDIAFGFWSVPAGARAFDLLDGVVNGDGFRADATFADADAVIAAVAAGSGQLGLVPMAAALSASDVKVLELRNLTLGICAAPSAETVLNGSYVGGERLVAYANFERIEQGVLGVKDALTAVLSEDGQVAVSSAGVVALPEAALAQARAVVENGTLGRVFSREVGAFQPVVGASGDVRVGGSAAGAAFVKSSLTTYTTNNPGVSLTEAYLGGIAGVRELCSGNLDIVVASEELTAEQAELCAALSIEVVSFDLGVQNAVLIGNAGDSALACLTVEQVKRAWSASAEAPATWDAVDAALSSDEIVLFAQNQGSAALDLLVNKANGAATPARDGVNYNADPLYLGAAVANVPGSLAVMTLAQAERVLAENSRVRLVAVDAGDGCVVPSESSILDGSYAFVLPVKLLLNQSTLASDAVQAAVWSLIADANYAQIVGAGLVGLELDTLWDKRDALQALFKAADALEAERFAAETAAIATQTAEAAAPQPTAEATEAAPVEDGGEAEVTPEG